MQKHPLLSGLCISFDGDHYCDQVATVTALVSLQSLSGGPPTSPRLESTHPQFLPSGFVPGAPPCCCSTPAAMELGQNLWVGRCCDLIFLALGAGSGLLASSMGCRMRLRALMNLPGGKGGRDLVNHPTWHCGVCVCARARMCAGSESHFQILSS